MLDLIWNQLQSELQELRRETLIALTRSERAETAGALRKSTLASAPLAAGGVAAGDVLWITNGRKTGEGAGVGTGCPAYYNPGDNKWKRMSDDSDVAI